MQSPELQSTLRVEGKTTLAVPLLNEPQKLPAFYNPKGKFVRDVSLICYGAYSEQRGKGNLSLADSLAGIGARGVRAANEVSSISTVFLNDINSRALDFAKKSAEINRVTGKCVFSRAEVSSFLTSRSEIEGGRFDIVDLDPFGTPSDFVECGIRAVKDGGVLSLTATDSAVLCGVYPKVAQRKYLGLPLRTEYSHEIGLRLLFGLASMTAMRLETGIEPLFCHHSMHYFRVYMVVKVGNSYSRQNEREIGFVLHCFSCGYRSIVSRAQFFGLREEGPHGIKKRPQSDNEFESSLFCPNCSKAQGDKRKRLTIAGPLWIGKIQSSDFLSICRKVDESSLSVFSEELELPLYYDLSTLKVEKGKGMPRINSVLQRLISLGYQASRTRLNPNSLRTDATREVLQTVVSELAR